MAAKEFPLAVVIRAVDRITGPMRAATSAIARFGARVRATGRGIGERLGLPVLGAAAGRLGGALAQLGKRVALIGGAIAAMGAAAIMAGWQMVRSFADSAGELNDLSLSLGISAERLQELRYAAKQTGVEAGQFDQGMRVLSRNLGEAFTKQKGPVFAVLEGMGIRLKGANGEMRRTEDLLPEIADKLALIKDPAVRAAAAQALLGRAGVKMLPMLLGGSKGLQQFAARARELGIVISNETIASADNFGDQLDDLMSSITGVRNVIGTALLPQLKVLVKQITDFTIKNRAKIEAFFTDFAAKMPERIDDAIKALGDLREAVQPVTDAVSWLVDRFGGANVALAAVAAVATVILVPALVATVDAIYLVTAALLTTPIGWIIGLVILLVVGLDYLYNRFESVRTVMDEVSASAIYFFENFTTIGILITQWDNMAASLSKVYDVLLPLGDEIAWVFMNMTPIGLAIQNWDVLSKGLGWLADVAKMVGGVIAWVFMNMTPIGLAIQNWDVLKVSIDMVWQVMEALGKVFEWFFMNLTPMGLLIQNWDAVKVAIDVVADALSDLWDGMKPGFEMAIGWVESLAGKLTGMIPDWAKGMFSGDGFTVRALGDGIAGALGAQQVGQSGQPGQNGEVRVRVDLGNLPPWAKVKTESNGRPNFELNQGYAMGIPG